MELLFQKDAYLKSTEAIVTNISDNGFLLDKTVFYPLGGGQPGDQGTLTCADGVEVKIINTLKGESFGEVLHVLEEGNAFPNIGDTVTVTLDWDLRYKYMRFHTAMHVLCSLIEGDVTGGNLSADKARLDFNLPDEFPSKDELTDNLRAIVENNHPVSIRWITDAELDLEPDLVRTMSVQPPRGSGKVRLLDIEGIDLQPCGGTHLKSTSEIGKMIVSKIENKGKQNRRFILRSEGDS
jgi:misacylated tRNA(Ala) deacylase